MLNLSAIIFLDLNSSVIYNKHIKYVKLSVNEGGGIKNGKYKNKCP